MIIRETADHFLLIEQHEHGRLSGDIARHLSAAILDEREPRADEVITAVYEHDRGWISLDEIPKWNPESRQPFTFEDYPLTPKLLAYREGLREIEEQSLYAALVCSMHYASFTQQAHVEAFKAFFAEEVERQKRLRTQLGLEENDPVVYKHFRLLQLCDDLSLYVCMNEPGADKDHEHPWFRDGFPNTSLFNPEGDDVLSAKWQDNQTVTVHPSPFGSPFEIGFRGRWVAKEQVNLLGIGEAYAKAEESAQTFVME